MDRRTLLTAGGLTLVATALNEGAEARAQKVPITPQDAAFMQIAIEQAKAGDYPFGAAIVSDGKVLALGRNMTRRSHDPTAHAEMVAIRAFLDGHEPDDFKSTTMYASGEPCAMCMGAIIWCGLKRLVFAASVAQLSARIGQIEISAAQVANASPFATIEITGGVLARESISLFAPNEAKPRDKPGAR